MPSPTRKPAKGRKFNLGGYSLLPSWSTKKNSNGKDTGNQHSGSVLDFNENWLYYFWKPFIFFAYLITSYLLLLFMWLTYDKKECPLFV